MTKLAIFEFAFALQVHIILKTLILSKHGLCVAWEGLNADVIGSEVFAHC